MAAATITRRNLVKGAALGTAAVAALGSTAALADETAPAGVEFAEEYDVVVLGMGGAGMCAAIAAYEEGAKVLLCEKAPAGQEPCNTKVAGQVILSTDDADQFYTYLTHLMGNYTNYDPECLRAYADGAAENWDWMINVLHGDPDVMYWSEEPDWVHQGGARFEKVESFMGIDRPGWILIWDEFPEFEGSEHSLIYTFSGREHDSSYYNQLRQNIDEREGENLNVWLGCPGVELICDEAGAVIGCYVEKAGERVAVRAKGGVCLPCGGFESNRVMIENCTQLPYLYPRAAALNTGDGIKMAMKVGADLWHMSNLSGLGFGYHAEGKVGASSPSRGVASIKVGPAGGRFMNEDAKARHGRVSFGGAWNMTPMAMPTYLITDASQIATPLVSGFSEGNVEEIESGVILQGETIDDLAAAIRAQGKAPNFNANGELEATLTAYNADVEAGVTDDFGRTPTVPLNTPPYYALELCPTCLNTQGGPRHNGLAQVLDMEAMPIEGLFSGGELGSIFPDMYNGGGNLGETMIFGRIAGRNAAHRAQGTFEGATEPARYEQQDLDDADAQAKADKAAADAALLDAPLADGTYQGTGKGYASDIVLDVTIEGGKIADVQVVSSNETAALGEAALPEYAAAIVETQDPAQIDVAAGASNTLKGFQEAINDALAQAAE